MDRRMTGRLADLAGRSAEAAVARHYERAGCTVAARRWRSAGGEIDLIARDGACVVFVEVKQAQSHAQAAARLGERQMRRIVEAATLFLGGEPRGTLTEARIDVALVDAVGRVAVIENAVAA